MLILMWGVFIASMTLLIILVVVDAPWRRRPKPSRITPPYVVELPGQEYDDPHDPIWYPEKEAP